MPHTPCSSITSEHPQKQRNGVCTLLNFCLPALEEVESVGGFGVHMLHYREDVKNILFCESGLVPVVKVVLLQQDLEGPKRVEGTVTTSIGIWQEKGQNSKWGFTVKTSPVP